MGSPYKDIDKLYRYEEVAYSYGVDENENPLAGYDLRLILYTYKVKRATAKGVWIKLCYFTNDEKFVHLGAKKQYASVTKEEAVKCYLARKRKQIEILSAKLEKAERAWNRTSKADRISNEVKIGFA